MARPQLFVQHGNSAFGAFQVIKTANGITETLFSYGNNSSYAAAAAARPVNMAIHWNDAVYAIAPEDGIYKWDMRTNVVSQIHTFSIPSTAGTSAAILGFFPVVKDDTTKLVCGYTTSSSTNIRMAFVDREDNVTETANLAININNYNLASSFSNPFMYQNKVYFNACHGGGIVETMIFDPETEALSVQQHTTGELVAASYAGLSFTPHSGVIMGVIQVSNSTPQKKLVRMDGQTAVNMGTWNAVGNSTSISNLNTEIFSHEGILYYLGYDDSSNFGLWRLWQNSDGTLNSAENVTSTVFGFSTSPDPTSDRFFASRDVETVTGTARTLITLGLDGNTSGASFNIYQFNGGSSPATFVGSLGDVFQWAPVRDFYGGGQYTFSASGEFNWTFEGSRVVGNNIEIDQTIYGDAPGAVVTMDLRFDNNFGPPLTQATLLSTTSGTLNGNLVEGLIPDGSGFIITTVWAASSNGITSGDSPYIDGRLFRSDL